MLPRDLERWLRASSHAEVPAAWVPGLSARERQALGAAGGVARCLLSALDVAALPAEVRTWMEDAPSPPTEHLEEFREVVSTDPDRAFAALYSAIVSRENRRQLGTFFTPSAEVKLMLDLWTESELTAPETVIDVGAGVGVFTAEAAKRWPEARVIAVDINPVTLGLLAVRLFSDAASNGAPDLLRRVELVRRDYTEWFVSDDAPPQGGRLVLGNPPYTRAQLMSLDDRERLHELTEGICGSRASLSTVITALTFQRLAPNDGLSLLLPAQWLESQYARDLRTAIWRQARRSVELRLVESEDLFGGAQVDAVALLIGTEQPSLQAFRVARWRGSEPTALNRQDDVPPSWRKAFDAPEEVPNTAESVPLSELAEVRRGVATGANATFVLSDAEAARLPSSAVTRVITRLGEFEDGLSEPAIQAASDRSVGWLLTLTEDQVAQDAALAELVAVAERAGMHERLLCSRRSVWYDLTAEVRRPDVIVGAMTQDRFKFVTNDIGATHTNNLYGLRWHENVGMEQRRQVLGWLRSDVGQAALTSAARRQGAGLRKLEPGGLRALRIPISVAETDYDTADGAPGKSALIGRSTSASVHRPLASSGR